MNRRRFLKLGAVAAATAALGGGASITEAMSLQVTRQQLPLGVRRRAVQISDTHFSTSVYSIEEAVELVRRERPEYVFHTGDVVSFRRDIPQARKMLGAISEFAEVYVVPGNHDHWQGLGAEELQKALGDTAEVLGNTSVYLDGFWLAGVEDPFTYHARLDKALEGVDSQPVLLLAHSPQIIGEAAGRVTAVLAGHTHGGQVRLPLLGALWLPLPKEYRRFDYGSFTVSGTVMYVTKGTGTGWLPVRLNCPPEIVSLRL